MNTIQIIPINKIRVLNPRTRNQKVFADLVENIAAIGLKRPITVTPSTDEAGEQCYNLLCGQGRLEACQTLGEETIPCRIIDVNNEESYLISLIENIARRKHTNFELLRGFKILSDRGYKPIDIARKTGFNRSYVNGILHLLNEGEERLINGVEKGFLPMTVAISISRAKNRNVQSTLTELYEKEDLKPTEIAKIRNMLYRRDLIGKKTFPSSSDRSNSAIYNPKTIVSIYKEETQRQQMMIKQAEFDEKQLRIIISCLSKLFKNKYFKLILQREELNDIPKDLSERMKKYYQGENYA